MGEHDTHHKSIIARLKPKSSSSPSMIVGHFVSCSLHLAVIWITKPNLVVYLVVGRVVFDSKLTRTQLIY